MRALPSRIVTDLSQILPSRPLYVDPLIEFVACPMFKNANRQYAVLAIAQAALREAKDESERAALMKAAGSCQAVLDAIADPGDRPLSSRLKLLVGKHKAG